MSTKNVCYTTLFIILSGMVSILYASDKIIDAELSEDIEQIHGMLEDERDQRRINNAKIDSVQIQLAEISQQLISLKGD